MAISQVLIPKRAINFHKKRKVKEKHVFGKLVIQESSTCNWASRCRQSYQQMEPWHLHGWLWCGWDLTLRSQLTGQGTSVVMTNELHARSRQWHMSKVTTQRISMLTTTGMTTHHSEHLPEVHGTAGRCIFRPLWDVDSFLYVDTFVCDSLITWLYSHPVVLSFQKESGW